ncbi:hypothetical protein LTR17_023410 [Elasticomyces elasticus]|nr:hypothetical protein LTR17_023410 [Elasticomyces elasticus]
MATESMPSDEHDTRCHLMSIPPELRICIYDQVFNQELTCKLDIGSTGHMYLKQSSGPVAALTSTSQAIRTEVLPILYAAVGFHLRFYDNSEMALHQHLQNVTGELRSCTFLRHIRLLHLEIDMRASRDEVSCNRVAARVQDVMEMTGIATGGKLALKLVELHDYIIASPGSSVMLRWWWRSTLNALMRNKSACEVQVCVDKHIMPSVQQLPRKIRGRLMGRGVHVAGA